MSSQPPPPPGHPVPPQGTPQGTPAAPAPGAASAYPAPQPVPYPTPQYPYPHPYPYPYPPYPPARSTNTMAILALVFGVLFAPVGIILGHIARRQIRERGEEGDTLALVGLIVGYVQTGLMVAACLAYVVGLVFIIGVIGLSGV